MRYIHRRHYQAIWWRARYATPFPTQAKHLTFPYEQNIRMIPNPAHFTINGVSFGVSSVDSLFHVKKEEYTKSGIEVEPATVPAESSSTDVMSNLCRQLLLQRRLVFMS